MAPPLKIEGCSIVALGSFNPAIFQPRWFASMGLLRQEQADDASVQVIHPDVSIFSTDWLTLQASKTRFSVQTDNPTKKWPLRDFASGTFSILEHTPLKAFGLNAYHHYGIESEDQWHAIGHHFAPKDSWNRVLDNPGMRSLCIWGKHESAFNARLQITIEPSVPLEKDNAHGVSIQINEHRNLPDEDDQAKQMETFLSVLRDRWDGFLTYSDHTCDELLSVIPELES